MMVALIQTPSLWETVKTGWPWVWGIIMLFSPLLIILLIVFVIKLSLRRVVKKVELNKQLTTIKKCPDCAESILKEANVCKFCGKKFL
jgi:hypothetical protein